MKVRGYNLEIFRFKQRSARWWAFKQMPAAKRVLAEQPGLTFGKLMGTGSGEGFSIWPDFGTYALLTVWEDPKDRHYFENHSWYQALRFNSESFTKLELRPLSSKGSWQGANPFQEESLAPEGLPYTMVLTRARIRTARLPQFWQNVPQVSKVIKRTPGLLYSKGVGEWPLIEQATVSFWQDQAAIDTFAYRKHEHQSVIKKTHRYNWYSEELFARFQVLSLSGRSLWQGQVSANKDESST